MWRILMEYNNYKDALYLVSLVENVDYIANILTPRVSGQQSLLHLKLGCVFLYARLCPHFRVNWIQTMELIYYRGEFYILVSLLPSVNISRTEQVREAM